MASSPNQSSKRQTITIPWWKDLQKDVLLAIYQRLEIKDLLGGAPLCCKSWYNASMDPSLWRHVNLECFDQFHRGKAVEFVVARSHGSINSIKFPSSASVEDFLFVAERCPGLKHFSIKAPLQSLELMEKIRIAISKLKELEGMGVMASFISDISLLKQISECCPNFNKLKVYDRLSESAASLITTSLPKLKSVDLSSTQIHRKAILVILKGCCELERLDITGCGKVYESDEILRLGLRRLKGEFKYDHEITDSCADCEEKYRMEMVDMCERDHEEIDYCSECEEAVCEMSYQWPCEHVMDDGFLYHLEGTQELAAELFPEPPYVGVYQNQEYDVDPVGDDDGDYHIWGNPYECDCCHGYDSDD